MANVKVEVLDAIVDGQGKGAVIDVEAKTAKHLASIGYVRVVEEKKAEKSEDKPAETTKSKRGK
jgi:hypothetical protein